MCHRMRVNQHRHISWRATWMKCCFQKKPHVMTIFLYHAEEHPPAPGQINGAIHGCQPKWPTKIVKVTRKSDVPNDMPELAARKYS